MRVQRRAIAILVLTACGDNASDNGPFDGLPIEGDFTEAALTAPVHVARDKYGVAHISGETIQDVSYVQGYVMAHDRLAQMDILRRYGAGTLSELFGALDPSVIDTDLEMRVHRMKPLARQTWDALVASTDPTDQQVVLLLQRFADGVNAYATDVRAKKWTIDPNVLISFDPERFVAWSPIDSLVLGRFQAFALCWSTPFEVDLTNLYQHARATYDNAIASNPAAFARRGISNDLIVTAPIGKKPTIDGFPNVVTDTGSRSDAGRAGRAHHGAVPAGPPPPARARRPHVPQQVFEDARTFLSTKIHDGPFGALGPHAFMRPWAGSNNWAVSPALAGGKALLATDQHLQLPNPAIFYPTHLIVKGQLDTLGVTFPGIPGVILGTNGSIAWSATVSEHDVNDVYLETIAPCGSGSCVSFNGQQVPIQTWTETIQIGALGTITDARTVTYELVPHHGPIIPKIANHQVVARTTGQALSVRFTGYEPTFEIRALWNLSHAKTVDAGFKALADFTYGSQNWTMIDNAGNIGWTTNALVPLRSPAAYTWDPVTAPDGLAPFMVLPGDGTAEWEGRLSSRYVPHAINPAQGYIATANADPVGATFDNQPLNQPIVDGRPLYVGITYAAGVREDRISTLIEQTAAVHPITLDDMARIQHDTHSNIGEKMIAPLLASLGRVDAPAGAPGDAIAYVGALAPADKQRLQMAKLLLTAWTQATPAAIGGTPSAQDLTDSAATTIFNAWMHYFLERALKDEYDAIGFDMWSIDDNFLARVVNKLLTDPDSLVQSATTHQPIVCDSYGGAGPDDSCTKVMLQAALDAMTHLEQTFATPDTTQWRWGKLHTLTLKPLFPNTALNVPSATDPNPAGFPKAGDNFVINRADQGWSDLDFKQYADGPAQRFLAEATVGQPIKVKWQLPGGVIYDSRDKHYRDLLDHYYIPQAHFDAPFAIAEIVASGESRWVFHR